MMNRSEYLRSFARRCLLLAICAILVGNARIATSAEPKAAEPAIQAANNSVRSSLPFSNRDDYRDAERGFIGTLPDALVSGANGNIVWSQKDYSFLDREDSPDTVNPSLWRQAQLNHRHGLFKVVDGIYQVRGLDASNMTLVETASGLIVVDPLISVETAKAALDLYYQYRPRRPVTTVIYTHSHGDHYGGVKGVVSEADVKAGKVVIIAPEGFLEHAVSESVIAGNAMRRRGQYQFGQLLPKGRARPS